MRRTTALVWSIALVFHFPVLFQPAEAVHPGRDKPTVASQNAASDPCIQLTEFSNEEEKKAADKVCKRAFVALDQNNLNSCRGWRRPGCRLLLDSSYKQCSCIISISNRSGIHGETRSFRGCALDIWIDRYFDRPVAPASGFKDLFKSVERSALAARKHYSHDSFNALGSRGDGTSYVPNIAYVGGLPVRTGASQFDAGTSRENTVGKGGKSFTCSICTKSYQSSHSLRCHRKQHTEDLRCKICQKQCSTKSNYRRHIKEVHKGKTAVPTKGKKAEEEYKSSKPYPCDVCGARFGAERSLKSHKISHDDSKPTTCTSCNITFSAPSSFRAHMKYRH